MSNHPTPQSSNGALIQVRDLRTWYPIRSGIVQRVVGHVKAVDGVSFEIPAGRTLALVGESGCGKTTAGKSILGLVKPTDGEIRYRGIDLTKIEEQEFRPLRRNLQVVFQDPYSSLNPRRTIAETLIEGMENHAVGDNTPERIERAASLLERVGLGPAALECYPHEFSGGQRQRIGIARALSVEPEFIVCDEPVSALDVSIQAQILNLLKDLQAEFSLTYLFITHDLGVVEYIADEVAVMYLGRIVEQAPCEQLFDEPRHPYTKALLSSVPVPDPKSRTERIVLSGDVPSPAAAPTGCHFHPRCPQAEPECSRRGPHLVELSPSHWVSCIIAEREQSR